MPGGAGAMRVSCTIQGFQHNAVTWCRTGPCIIINSNNLSISVHRRGRKGSGYSPIAKKSKRTEEGTAHRSYRMDS